MGLFDKLKSDNKPKEEQYKAYCFLKTEEKLNVLRLNKDFDLSTAEKVEKGIDRVYRYDPVYKFGVELVPDNKNANDKNAVAITINGQFFGYVSREAAPELRKAIKKNAIQEVRLVIKGGPMIAIYGDKATAFDSDLDCQLYVKY